MTKVKGLLQGGFTLIEIAIVLLVVTVLLGYTVAMFPIQQELRQYRQANQEMDEILKAIVGFAQVNGRLPCPAWPSTGGREAGGGLANCQAYTGHVPGDPWIGFVPANTLGINGRFNEDSLLIDPWGNPYRYYVTDSDFFTDRDNNNSLDDDSPADNIPDGDDFSDYVVSGQMRDIGIADRAIDEDFDGVDDIDADGFTDLDPRLIICDGASTAADRCTGSNEVVGNVTPLTYPVGGNYNGLLLPHYTGYAGVPVVLLSMGKNWPEASTGDELENQGASESDADLGMGIGPSGLEYLFDTDSVFVKRTTGQAEDFDDIVKWISNNTLLSEMVKAGQLP